MRCAGLGEDYKTCHTLPVSDQFLCSETENRTEKSVQNLCPCVWCGPLVQADQRCVLTSSWAVPDAVPQFSDMFDYLFAKTRMRLQLGGGPQKQVWMRGSRHGGPVTNSSAYCIVLIQNGRRIQYSLDWHGRRRPEFLSKYPDKNVKQ